jgi:hypothetical protein
MAIPLGFVWRKFQMAALSYHDRDNTGQTRCGILVDPADVDGLGKAVHSLEYAKRAQAMPATQAALIA